jgi:hypothetical protein
MAVQTKRVNTCDSKSCTYGGRIIAEGDLYVDAQVYGCTFHKACWDLLSGPALVRALGLDDIKWRIEGLEGPDGGKVIYTTNPTKESVVLAARGPEGGGLG